MATVKFGYWTEKVDEETTNPLFKYRFYCSECGNWQSYGRTLFCPNCGAKMTMTNGDRIRAMMDEELADWMYGVITNALNILQIGSDVPTQSYFGWLDWLKQEVKG